MSEELWGTDPAHQSRLENLGHEDLASRGGMHAIHIEVVRIIGGIRRAEVRVRRKVHNRRDPIRCRPAVRLNDGIKGLRIGRVKVGHGIARGRNQRAKKDFRKSCCAACLAEVKRVPSTKLITVVGISLNFSQASRVVLRSLLRAPWPRPRFMNGKSSAHQTMPITGTQMSSCFRKNFRKGMWPWNMRCSTRMSTQLWWLLDTRYQPRGCRLFTPCTSHFAGLTAAIQALLLATQREASALTARSQVRRTAVAACDA